MRQAAVLKPTKPKKTEMKRSAKNQKDSKERMKKFFKKKANLKRRAMEGYTDSDIQEFIIGNLEGDRIDKDPDGLTWSFRMIDPDTSEEEVVGLTKDELISKMKAAGFTPSPSIQANLKRRAQEDGMRPAEDINQNSINEEESTSDNFINNSKHSDESILHTIREIVSKEGEVFEEIDISVEELWWAESGFELNFEGMEFYVIPQTAADEATKKYLTNDKEELLYTVENWVIADNTDDEGFFNHIEDDEVEAAKDWLREDEPNLDDEALHAKALDYWVDKIRDETAISYLEELYGEEEAASVLQKNFSQFIDVDGVADDIIDTDGRGHVLSGYDGVEKEVPEHFYYRWN